MEQSRGMRILQELSEGRVPAQEKKRTAQPRKAGWEWWAWVGAAALLVPLVWYIQQFTLDLRGQTLESVPREVREREEPEDPGISEFTIQAKLLVKGSEGYRGEEDREGQKALDAMALTRVDRERAAMVAGEVCGSGAALERIGALEREAEPGGAMAAELGWLKKVYTEGPDSLPQEARESLVDRHGWFGTLALVRGKPLTDPVRAGVMGGMGRLGLSMLVLMGVMGLAFLCGVAGLIGVWRAWRLGVMESGYVAGGSATAGGGNVYLETFVVFTGGFLFLLCMHLVMFGMNAEASRGALAFLEVLSWLLAGLVLWPLVRKVPWGEFAKGVGLHVGEGWKVELGYGLLGWVISLPVSVAIGILIGWLASGGEEKVSTGKYPLFHPPPGGSWGMLWLSLLGALVWAPILEEIIFRGALYRALRERVRWWVAAVIVAAVFGFVHPYTTAGLVQVGVMGLVLACLREWRGSLVAPMTCHFLHNASIGVVTVMVAGAVG